MLRLLCRLWKDERGALLSIELFVVAGVAVLGVIGVLIWAMSAAHPNELAGPSTSVPLTPSTVTDTAPVPCTINANTVAF